MNFQFLVTVEVSREQGKFASKEDLAEKIRSELESADPSSLTGDNDGEYNVDSWEVEDYVEPAGKAKQDKMEKALKVIALSSHIKLFLQDHDPMALKQVMNALK